MFLPICPPAFFRCLSNSGAYTKLQTTSFIESPAVVRGEIEKSGMVDHIWKEKGNHLPLWDIVEMIDRAENWRIRCLKESATMPQIFLPTRYKYIFLTIKFCLLELVKLATIVKGDQKALFSIAAT